MKGFLLGIAGCLFAVTANASLVTINFDDYPPNTFITNQYAAQGVTFSLEGAGAPIGPRQYASIIPPNAFGTSGGTIVPGVSQVDNNFDIRIAFSELADFFSIYALDAEEPFSIRAYLGATHVGTASQTHLGHLGPVGTYFVNGPVIFAAVGAIGGAILFDSVLIDLSNGPGASEGGPEVWDNFSVNLVSTHVPEPATLALLGLGLAGLGVARRRKTA